MKEFYVVLVTIALINCIGLSRITGPAGGPRRPGDPGVVLLFALSLAGLLLTTTLFGTCVFAIAGHVTGQGPTPLLGFALAGISSGLLLLPLSAFLQARYRLPYLRLRVLLPMAAGEAMLLSGLLLVATRNSPPWNALFWSASAAAGIVALLTVFDHIRLRQSVSDVPQVWRGLPIELTTAGILALALLSPAGALP